MTIPTVTTLNTHGKHYHPKGDGRGDTFIEMLTVKNYRLKSYSPPLVSADYWQAMPQVEARLEAARAARAEQERAENYRATMEALGKFREVKAAPKTLRNIRRIRKQRCQVYDWEALELIMVELRGRGMTHKEIGKELDLDTTTVHRHLKKRGVA